MAPSFDYQKAFEEVKSDLAQLIRQRDELEKQITTTRVTLESLAAHCASKGIEIEPSIEAEYLLGSSTLTDEIVHILRAEYPAWLFPAQIKQRLERLGHDMGKYTNPLATIHQTLKRLLDAQNPRIQQHPSEDGSRMMYRAPRIDDELAKAMLGEYKPRRATPASSSFAAKHFAEIDAKNKK